MEENKKLKCPVCGCDDLHFINVPQSKKDTSTLFSIIFAISLLIAVTALFILPEIIIRLIDSTSVMEGLEKALTIILLILIVQSALTPLIISHAILKVLPYKNKNEIHYVCPCCGKHSNIENIRALNNDKTEPNENCKNDDWYGVQL